MSTLGLAACFCQSSLELFDLLLAGLLFLLEDRTNTFTEEDSFLGASVVVFNYNSVATLFLSNDRGDRLTNFLTNSVVGEAVNFA